MARQLPLPSQQRAKQPPPRVAQGAAGAGAVGEGTGGGHGRSAGEFTAKSPSGFVGACPCCALLLRRRPNS